jgi:hypothetical protein
MTRLPRARRERRLGRAPGFSRYCCFLPTLENANGSYPARPDLPPVAFSIAF